MEDFPIRNPQKYPLLIRQLHEPVLQILEHRLFCSEQSTTWQINSYGRSISAYSLSLSVLSFWIHPLVAACLHVLFYGNAKGMALPSLLYVQRYLTRQLANGFFVIIGMQYRKISARWEMWKTKNACTISFPAGVRSGCL